MTLERTATAEAQDVKAVWLVCKECGTVQGYNPATWKGSLIRCCGNCPSARQWHESVGRQQVEALLTALQELSKQTDLPFEIRLQFDSLIEK